eukprot:TRINITY_DN2576_c0_g2_i2.p1 TRINITY_DN2576_c0_g2~~TRINITY_DN2576_c0_g2_i2.p1  ORF type:complete len:210 (-),score=24.39 TRINITY_DN2576_c0_g2_i2:13-642(-)
MIDTVKGCFLLKTGFLLSVESDDIEEHTTLERISPSPKIFTKVDKLTLEEGVSFEKHDYVTPSYEISHSRSFSQIPEYPLSTVQTVDEAFPWLRLFDSIDTLHYSASIQVWGNFTQTTSESITFSVIGVPNVEAEINVVSWYDDLDLGAKPYAASLYFTHSASPYSDLTTESITNAKKVFDTVRKLQYFKNTSTTSFTETFFRKADVCN